MKALPVLLLLGLSLAARADTPRQVLARLQAAAAHPASAERGDQLFHDKFSGGKTESCSTCHTADPRVAGRHARTNKAIEPLAPVANRERFSDPEKVEKWFWRNCNEVLGRACTAQEKVDFAAYLLAQK